MRLLSADATDDGIGLRFDGCTFGGYSNAKISQPIDSIVGMLVQEVSLKERDFVVKFVEGAMISLSLVTGECNGPEAFCAHFDDDTIVVVNDLVE
jgi:hypothetical protein